MSNKWNDFRPTKTLWFWSCAGSVALTMVVGFTVGGWVTGGTATEMAEDARDKGRMELAANVCVARFTDSDDFATTLANLKAESTWSRDDFVTDGGWVKLDGVKDPVSGAAELCAETLAEMEAPAPAKASTTPDPSTTTDPMTKG